MTTDATTWTAPTAEETAERFIGNAATMMEVLGTELGVRLGLYRVLAEGATDPRGLAESAGIHPRYAREWLEQQAVVGLVRAADTDTDPYARVFTLPDGPREALLDEDSPAYVATLPGFITSFVTVLPEVAEAFRSGGGVSYETYGAGTRHGIAGVNRPGYLSQITEWVATLPDIHARLTTGPARVLDLGCGTGWSSIAIAEAFPAVSVHGVDLDAASVDEARANAQRSGLSERVTFEHADAAAPEAAAPGYDLVCVFEAFHDMADPVAVLRTARSLLTDGGAVLIADERVAQHFTAPGDLLERLNYGFSVLHCLPATRAEGATVEAGTVLRPDTLCAYAQQAGFAECAELPIEHDLWRFYRLDPA
ncbi:class I SAM-dependent methyltransferase [Salinactinospora qingdaonensis]|uniref:Class I SAM-dependent methyltransferase n=1 Tax=Salinactinospora qingdaonensis TaxID=702744 RepID=A0ABP7F1V3_9ACTN